ncbi:fibronectin type III domain-containing protein [Psychroserpens sp. XS_ASV72]|uniref:fibronectin type III domain-containing protein n=1 Tax=Psychroserpens sp. XS_ASV72 TaxID=3241293 RepID=UPI00351539C7
MRKLNLLFILVFTVFACNNDDDTVDVCRKAKDIQVSNVTDNSATLNWNDPNNAGSYVVEYGISGFALGSGTTLNLTETNVDLLNLSSETTYDVYIRVVCGAENKSMYSDIFNFTTSITPCEPVTNVSMSMISDTSVMISWEDTANQSATYSIEYGASGFSIGSGTTITETNTSVEITGLESSTDYDVYIKVICAPGNESSNSNVVSFTTSDSPIVPEFRPTLSELNLYLGNLGNLSPSSLAFEYDLVTPLFTDYAHKQRLIALPEGTSMTYNGDGFPLFPDNTVISKTFYYNNDETDLSQGKNIIETRVLIKIDGSWELGNYKWNEAQTDAVIDTDGGIVPVTWVNGQGESQSIDYEIPNSNQCFICHNNNSEKTPIGPKLRTLNFNVNGENQLQTMIDHGLLAGLSDPSSVDALPDWEDTSLPLDRRARAYMDINCAHCHIPGGFCENQSNLRLSYETPFGESNITESSNSILARIQNTIPEYGMPYIGTTILHDEGVQLMIDYINSLE